MFSFKFALVHFFYQFCIYVAVLFIYLCYYWVLLDQDYYMTLYYCHCYHSLVYCLIIELVVVKNGSSDLTQTLFLM